MESEQAQSAKAAEKAGKATAAGTDAPAAYTPTANPQEEIKITSAWSSLLNVSSEAEGREGGGGGGGSGGGREGEGEGEGEGDGAGSASLPPSSATPAPSTATALQHRATAPKQGSEQFDLAFQVDHIFSAAECHRLILAAEEHGFGRTNYPHEYRGNLRLITVDPSLATAIWQRIKHCVCSITVHCSCTVH